MEKRRHDRIECGRLLADISDGAGFFTGIIKDFSRFGLLLEDVPQRLNETSSKVSVIFRSDTTHYKLKAKTRWTKKQAISKMVGFEIINAPWGWAEFVMENENNPEKSLGEITI